MSTLIARRDLDFLLHEVLAVGRLCERPRFAAHDRATFDNVLDSAFELAEAEYAPYAAKLDQQEPSFDGTRVSTIPELKRALDAYVAAGFMGASFAERDGGLQLPFTVTTAAGLVFAAANLSVQNYAGLTAAAAHLLLAHGDETQKRVFALPMVEGRWFGAMALSETQAGSSLATVRTKAEPVAGTDRYRLTGSKMWISGAEHELAENIVCLVLARLPDAPAGVKGISLFIVPKFVPDADGRPGVRNAGLRLIGLNRKMGQRGTTNCVLSLGDDADCIGYLVGEPHRGLSLMFHMMNAARVGVGAAAVALAYTAYLHALDYARTRVQGPSLVPARDRASVAIIEHPDVKRMLLAQKAIAEGGLALCLACARLMDELETEPDGSVRDDLVLRLELLTPIAKSWPSERGCEANSLAIQVLGGYGYTHDFPLERLYRDQRLNPIHEGTTGIHGLDLLGRKVRMQQGRALALIVADIGDAIVVARDTPALARWAGQLGREVETLTALTTDLLARVASDPERGLADATLYLDLVGTIAVGWRWLRQASAAIGHAGDDGFYDGKLATCAYYYRYEMARATMLAGILADANDVTVRTRPHWL